MATQGGGKKLPAKNGVPNSDYYIPPLPVVVAPVRQSVADDIMGWVAAVLLAGLMLPLLGFLYVDILVAKNEVKTQVQKVEKLMREVEKAKKDKE